MTSWVGQASVLNEDTIGFVLYRIEEDDINVLVRSVMSERLAPLLISAYYDLGVLRTVLVTDKALATRLARLGIDITTGEDDDLR